MKFGVFLPSFIWEGDGYERAEGIKRFARRVEELGFDSIFLTDHVITAKRFYKVSWLEPLITHALVAGVTERVKLGTSILIAPLRQPVVLAKEIATLQYLSGGRFIFGAGVGWYAPEFEACGTSKRVRGSRTDEILSIVEQLLTRENVSFRGKHFDISDVTVEPIPPQRPPIWIGGGSQLADPASPEHPSFAKPVIERIARYEGWIARPTSTEAQIADDLQSLKSYLKQVGRDPSTVTMAHENFVHIVETNDRDKALAEQRDAYYRVMSKERSFDYISSVYLVGTPDDIVEKLQARARAGIEYFILHTLTPDEKQLDLWAKYILPHFETSAVTGRSSHQFAAQG